MDKLITTAIIFLATLNVNTIAQDNRTAEKFGNILNLGLGIGYYGYVGYTMPELHGDFEFAVAKNFTLAPFFAIYSYQNGYYWGNKNYPYRNYSYRQTVIPFGV